MRVLYYANERGIDLKKHTSIISIVVISLLIISFTIVGVMKIKTTLRDTIVFNPPGVNDNSTETINYKNENDDKIAFLLEKERMAKGGVIGTDGKGVVALRFDDYQNIFREKIYPLLVARGLPCSMALVSQFNVKLDWGIGTTWNDIRDWNRNGVEIWSHGTDHQDYSKDGDAGLYKQIVTSKEEIEAQDIKVVGWALPGVKPSTSNLPYNGLKKPEDYNSTTGRMLKDTYALTEAYAYNPVRTLPMDIYHGANHKTVSDGEETLSSSIEAIDAAIKNKSGIELMCHSGNLEKPGNMTFKEYETLLDYIKAQWDNGLIEVLTPSGMFFADPNSNSRLKLNTDDSFEGLTVASPGAWKETKNWNNVTIEKNSGRTGENFLRISGSDADSGVTQKIANLDELGVSGEQFVFEGWFRGDGSGDTAGVVKINDCDNPNNLNIVKTAVSVGTSWTRVRFVFCLPPGTKNITLSICRGTGAAIDWDDVTIKKI